jgi:hypothetical protein
MARYLPSTYLLPISTFLNIIFCSLPNSAAGLFGSGLTLLCYAVEIRATISGLPSFAPQFLYPARRCGAFVVGAALACPR